MPTVSRGMVLGRLERQTLDVIWESNECSVRDVLRKISRKRAYTTIMTTLDRLYQKGILNRKQAAGKFLYSARLSRQQLEKHMAQDLIGRLLAGSTTSRELIVLSLLEAIRRQDSRLFDEQVTTVARAKRRRSG